MRVLFVCVHNSGRSQMAEAFTRALSGGAVDVRSAGTLPGEALNPVVAEAMEERGISLAGQHPKVIDQQMADSADYAFTMGCAIDEACPAVFIPSEDWGLDDPSGQPNQNRPPHPRRGRGASTRDARRHGYRSCRPPRAGEKLWGGRCLVVERHRHLHGELASRDGGVDRLDVLVIDVQTVAERPSGRKLPLRGAGPLGKR